MIQQKPFSDFVFVALCLALLILFVISLGIGEINFDWRYVFAQDQMAHKIVFFHRLPRSLTALLCGISLPLSGWVLQELFNNPLAGPSVLGVSSSAGLGVAVLIVLGGFFLADDVLFSPWTLILSALVGALLSMFLLLIIAKKINSTVALIIIGFMISALSGALISLLQFFAQKQELQSMILWNFGSLNHLDYQKIIYFSMANLLGIVMIGLNIPALGKSQIGSQYAQTMGVNVQRLRLQLIFAASLLTGTATALVGPIAFIGLAVPHICRTWLKTANFYRLFSYILVMGMLLMLLFSILAQLFPWGSLPINIITSLLGAPIVLFIISKNAKTWN